MIHGSPYALAFFGLLPISIGTSLSLRGSMLLTLAGRFIVGAALGLDALTIASFLAGVRLPA